MSEGKPTSEQKNKLPFDIRKSYNLAVDIYQQIQNYELGFNTEEYFIEKVREINIKYENINEKTPLLS